MHTKWSGKTRVCMSLRGMMNSIFSHPPTQKWTMPETTLVYNGCGALNGDADYTSLRAILAADGPTQLYSKSLGAFRFSCAAVANPASDPVCTVSTGALPFSLTGAVVGGQCVNAPTEFVKFDMVFSGIIMSQVRRGARLQ